MLYLRIPNSKASDHHRLLLNLSDKKVLQRADKYVAP